jgi:hypothetical protein
MVVCTAALVSAQVKVTTIAGGYVGDGKPATSAALQRPKYIAMDPGGNFYISDYYHRRIRIVGPGGTIKTFAGTGFAGFSGDGGQSKQARINLPTGVMSIPPAT